MTSNSEHRSSPHRNSRSPFDEDTTMKDEDRSRSGSPQGRRFDGREAQDDERRGRSGSSKRKRSRSSSSQQFSKRGRSSSRGHRRGGSHLGQRGVDIVNIADEDASFILGAGGRTKRKLSRVCGAELNIKEHEGRTILEIRGTDEARDRAKLYVDFVMQQRVGPVRLKPDQQTRDDLTCIKVPHECVGYVTGRKGQGLRSIEEEWGTLMFFTDLRSESTGEFENLAIFAPDERKRRGAELKVMSAVEQKMPGHYTKDTTEFIDESDAFGTDRVPIKEEDYSYALGKEGATRKKLARASGAILEYVGRIAFVSGNKCERERAREYLQWLCAQRTNYVHVVDEGRGDCMVVQVPTNCVAYVTGSKGSSLRRIEDISGTFIFLDGTSRGRDNEKLLIFGHDSNGRRHAKELVLERIDEKLSGRSNRNYYRGRSRSRSPLRRTTQ
ncbi:uncharacterized protein LOC129617862 [Condylostylus longicornis]|uniref:uncharacterized protein LOC129617862 n=1 Tax=Condylostylus longicornis TaxID=2530218 RepID=UPI00244DC7EB|nr:uncharacterized protein LOC129617862 [Condylostylus longicornis]